LLVSQKASSLACPYALVSYELAEKLPLAQAG
jgi:hypothetical protein